MSYSNESFRAKLDTLQETQDSIVSTSTWVLFHYRHADRIASEWESYLFAAPPHRKLAVIYLANDVVQQARARKRTEFIDAFFRVLPGSLSNAYKKVPPPVQQRIVKIVNVLGERKVFPQPIVLTGVQTNGVPGTSPSGGTEDEKLKALASSGQRFHKFYHALLISANGTFTDVQLPYLQRLKVMLRENIGQLQDLETTVVEEIEKTSERSKAAKEKLEELKKMQKQLEEQKILEEMTRQEELKKQAAEDAIIPSYTADSDEDSDEDVRKNRDSDSDSEDEDEKKETTNLKKRPSSESHDTGEDGEEEGDSCWPHGSPDGEEPAKEEKVEATEPEVQEKPKKRLRFA